MSSLCREISRVTTCAVAFDRYACVGADRPDVVESLTGHRMERPVV